jgi:hypothetical protein
LYISFVPLAPRFACRNGIQNLKVLGWAMWRAQNDDFCKVSTAIPLFTSLLSSSMLQGILTLFIEVPNIDSSSIGSGWLLDNSTSYGIHIVASCLLRHSGAKILVPLCFCWFLIAFPVNSFARFDM